MQLTKQEEGPGGKAILRPRCQAITQAGYGQAQTQCHAGKYQPDRLGGKGRKALFEVEQAQCG